MGRKFRPFDLDTIRKEFEALSHDDFLDLTHAMKLLQDEAGIGYTVKDYGNGLKMVKGSRQGRCLWTEHESGLVMVAVLVYKKESEETPKHIMDTARSRMKSLR